MLPTAGVPFLTHLLARIREAGIKHVVLGTSFKAEVFEQHFADGSDFGLEIAKHRIAEHFIASARVRAGLRSGIRARSGEIDQAIRLAHWERASAWL